MGLQTEQGKIDRKFNRALVQHIVEMMETQLGIMQRLTNHTFKGLEETSEKGGMMIEVIGWFEQCIKSLCACCKRLNPQHSECTECSEVNDYREIINRAKMEKE